MSTSAADRDTSSPSDDRRPPSGATPLVATLVLFLIAMLASALAGAPKISLREPGRPDPPITPTEQATPMPLLPVQPEEDPGIADAILKLVLLLLVVGVILFVVYVVVRALIDRVRAWSARPPLQDAAPTDAETHGAATDESAPDAAVIRRGIAAARADISAHPDPGDAIIAAWVGLEETAADSGSARGRSETPAEFTLRILLRREGIDVPTRLLLRLYEGVRFAGRSASEQDRNAALAALTEIEGGWR
ncbi:DUF4129 domain-containing protein [Microbacterium sp. NPDC058345]|uniref:DUF4129 domain-containing protein n=1 Tax=Microbacterium sp. NPDC058345 TaxID=3346455 RepID=UPI003661622E